MAAITQLNPTGVSGQRYGSFAGKEASEEPAGPHNPGILTQLAPYGVSGMRYGSFAGKGEAVEPQPEPSGQIGGGRVRRKERYAIQVDGEWLVFTSWGALEAYLESLKEKELQEAPERVERAVQRILRTGKAPKKAPRIVVQKAPREVREHVDLLNAQIERVFWRKVEEEIASRGDEEDIELLFL